MDIKERSAYHYCEKDMNCAESVLHGADDALGLELPDCAFRAIGAFGGGCGCGEMCGAVAASVETLGLLHIKTRAHESADVADITKDFIDRHRELYGSVLCRDLKERNWDEANGKCLSTVKNASALLEETIKKYE